MKEICVDARMLHAFGIGTYLRNLLPLIEQGPFKLRLIVNKEAVKSLSWLSRFDLIVCSIPIYSIEEQIQLPLLIPKCDLLWSPHYNVPLLPTSAKRRLVTLHDVNHLALKRPAIMERFYAKRVMKGACSRSKKIITVSQFSKREICKYLKTDPKKIEVIHPGVDHKIFFPHEDGLSAYVKGRYGLPEAFFLFVGNIKPHKNVSGLIKGFITAFEELENIQLIIVGGDPDSELLARHPDLRERVRFLGYVEEDHLPSLYRLATAKIFPSFYEGFGSPAVEAMSCGCPLAVSNAASLPEVCADAAVYFDPNRSEEIGAVLKQFAHRKDLLEELKEKGVRRSREFCWEKCAATHLRVIEEVLQ